MNLRQVKKHNTYLLFSHIRINLLSYKRYCANKSRSHGVLAKITIKVRNIHVKPESKTFEIENSAYDRRIKAAVVLEKVN